MTLSLFAGCLDGYTQGHDVTLTLVRIEERPAEWVVLTDAILDADARLAPLAQMLRASEATTVAPTPDAATAVEQAIRELWSAQHGHPPPTSRLLVSYAGLYYAVIVSVG